MLHLAVFDTSSIIRALFSALKHVSSPPHTRASGWARRLVCPFPQQSALVCGQFSYKFCLARKKAIVFDFFCLAGQNSQHVQAIRASSLARKINQPMKTHNFFTWFILTCTWQEIVKHIHYDYYHILLSFFFWISQIILNVSGMSKPTKHFGSSVALEGDTSQKWFIQAQVLVIRQAAFFGTKNLYHW